MDQGTLVEAQIDDGRRFVERFAADGNPVQAAFWVKTAEEGLWFLYVVTEIIDRDGPAAAYRAVHASLESSASPRFPVPRSKSSARITPSPRMCWRSWLVIRAGWPRAARPSGRSAVEQTIHLPPHFFTFTQANPMTTEDIGREILRLMNRGPGILQPSRVTLKDGTAFNGVPFALKSAPKGTGGSVHRGRRSRPASGSIG